MSEPITPLRSRAGALSPAAPERWPVVGTFGAASVIALVMSTEFLAQPFVWRGWGLLDILSGWATVLLDRMIVAVAIALCLVSVGQARVRRPVGRGVLIGLAILAGAAGGECVRGVFDPLGDRPDFAATLGRIAAWTLAGSAAAGIVAAWRSGAADEAAAQSAQLRAARLLGLATATQLEALQRQIEPHFLFNTLATIKRLGVTSPEEGRLLLSRFLAFTSATLAAGGATETTLGQELDLARAYLDVCAARMGPRLSVTWSVDPEVRDRRFPTLMLGTLIENAVKHGLAPLAAGGEIAISARRVDGGLEVAVVDTGAGVTADSGLGIGGAGIGLANLTERLRLLYGSRAFFRLEPGPAGGVRAVIGAPDAAWG